MAEALWSPDPVSFKNERYTVYPAYVGPKPAEPIPVLLGGRGKKALDRVARRASGWISSPPAPPSGVGATLRTLRQKAADCGRNPAELSCTAVISLSPFGEFPELGRLPYTGSMDQVISDPAGLASVGVAEVALTLPYLATNLASASCVICQPSSTRASGPQPFNIAFPAQDPAFPG
jgi:hypothetical protein